MVEECQRWRFGYDILFKELPYTTDKQIGYSLSPYSYGVRQFELENMKYKFLKYKQYRGIEIYRHTG